MTPIDWIEDAWFAERHAAPSALVSAESRPSGRPIASSAPRTTRCVKRCTRWSAGLPEKTLRPAIAYEHAKSLLRNASALCATHGTSPITTVRPPMRCQSGRRWHTRSAAVRISPSQMYTSASTKRQA